MVWGFRSASFLLDGAVLLEAIDHDQKKEPAGGTKAMNNKVKIEKNLSVQALSIP